MKVLVAYPPVCKKSATELSDAIGGHLWNPFDTKFPIGVKHDLIFNYGCSSERIPQGNRERLVNPRVGVLTSRDKIATYKALQQAKVPTCDYVTDEKDVKKSWNWVVCRETTTGRNCEGVLITKWNEIVPKQPLYTKFFPHDEEHRIVVYKDKVIGRYMKSNLKDGEYELVLMDKRGYEGIDPSAILGARAVGLDYAGVDVLFNSRSGRHLVLEVNSGPLLTEESLEFFINLFKGK